jgi:hypothetical protein
VRIDELLSLFLAKGAHHVMSLLIDLIRRREVKGDASSSCCLYWRRRWTRRGIDDLKKSAEHVGEQVDEVKRGVGGLDKRLLAVLEAPKSVN